MKEKNFLKRIYTVMEIRTGFATGLPVLSGGLFGAYLSGNIDFKLLLLMFISGFSFNIVANISNEIRAYIKNEENEYTFTGHKGSEGLVRGDAKLKDAIIAFMFMIILGGVSGLAIVLITKDIKILLIGILSLLAAIGYSLGPKPYILYPVGEIISGIFVGLISCVVSSYLQLGSFSLEIFMYATISMIMTVFLMSTNNTSDYLKDKGARVTLPHVIGFRNSIKILIPEAIIMVIAWVLLYILGYINIIIFITGLFTFYYYGYIKFYRDYYKIKEVYKEMSKEWGPRPLLLIYAFHISISIEFLIFTIFK